MKITLDGTNDLIFHNNNSLASMRISNSTTLKEFQDFIKNDIVTKAEQSFDFRNENFNRASTSSLFDRIIKYRNQKMHYSLSFSIYERIVFYEYPRLCNELLDMCKVYVNLNAGAKLTSNYIIQQLTGQDSNTHIIIGNVNVPEIKIQNGGKFIRFIPDGLSIGAHARIEVKLNSATTNPLYKEAIYMVEDATDAAKLALATLDGPHSSKRIGQRELNIFLNNYL